MSRRTARFLPIFAVLAVLAGCATAPEQPPPAPAAPPVVPTLPPSFAPQELAGNWGLAAYHKEEDRERMVSAAANQCRNPYVISVTPAGGLMMHLADQSTPSELRLKGAPGGKDYIGPGEDPPGSMQDREVVQFDGRVLILHWMDPEVQGRYGNMVYVRCGAPAKKPPARRAPPASRPKPT